MVSSTSARPSGGGPGGPAKRTSSLFPPRRDLAPCSPITQARASTTLDLPEPLGPTMQVIPGSSWSVVDEAKDLNPLRVRLFRYNAGSPLRWRGRDNGRTAGAAGADGGSAAWLTLPRDTDDPGHSGAVSEASVTRRREVDQQVVELVAVLSHQVAHPRELRPVELDGEALHGIQVDHPGQGQGPDLGLEQAGDDLRRCPDGGKGGVGDEHALHQLR